MSENSQSSLFQKIVNQRWLAYVSEVGESLRPIIPRAAVNTGYAISGAYVLAETALYGKRLYAEKDALMKTKTIDRGIWHTFASMAFPALAVNRTVHTSKWVFKGMIGHLDKKESGLWKTNLYHLRRPIIRFGPTLVAMSIIPFIIHPIDDAVDYCMDKSIRQLYFKRCIF